MTWRGGKYVIFRQRNKLKKTIMEMKKENVDEKNSSTARKFPTGKKLGNKPLKC